MGSMTDSFPRESRIKHLGAFQAIPQYQDSIKLPTGQKQLLGTPGVCYLFPYFIDDYGCLMYWQLRRVEKQMSRARSPKYPSNSLPDALERIKKVFDADRQNPIDRSAAAVHIGYSGRSGAADKALSNLAQYGLLENAGKGEVRVSDLAKNILYALPGMDIGPQLLKAAFNPPLFSALRSQFKSVPSKETLTHYLMREGFVGRTINPICSAYLETCSYLEQKGAYDLSVPSAADDAESHDQIESEVVPMVTPISEAPPASINPTLVPETSADVFNLSGGGKVILTLPEEISENDYEDLKDWLEIMARKAKRRIIDPETTEH